ncbi:hypothetical protein QJS04_geneDACA021299 [Acorus gramineus]|uniref:Uncharacterized protein n=1 Tax=Acorus gramineus TaxID=55184 RepID=A0AAV9ALS0_ACOGR|nr:hypothetical protein QJS04_geneDACA021299 [Acorus gramineus]
MNNNGVSRIQRHRWMTCRRRSIGLVVWEVQTVVRSNQTSHALIPTRLRTMPPTPSTATGR